jgi:hypothetical protein
MLPEPAGVARGNCSLETLTRGVGDEYDPGLRTGGADRIRTCDLLIANETLYQLSYDPAPISGVIMRRVFQRARL